MTKVHARQALFVAATGRPGRPGPSRMAPLRDAQDPRRSRLLLPRPRRRRLPLRQHLRTMRQLRRRPRVPTRPRSPTRRHPRPSATTPKPAAGTPRPPATNASSPASTATSAGSKIKPDHNFCLTRPRGPVNRAVVRGADQQMAAPRHPPLHPTTRNGHPGLDRQLEHQPPTLHLAQDRRRDPRNPRQLLRADL